MFVIVADVLFRSQFEVGTCVWHKVQANRDWKYKTHLFFKHATKHWKRDSERGGHEWQTLAEIMDDHARRYRAMSQHLTCVRLHQITNDSTRGSSYWAWTLARPHTPVLYTMKSSIWIIRTYVWRYIAKESVTALYNSVKQKVNSCNLRRIGLFLFYVFVSSFKLYEFYYKWLTSWKLIRFQ